jgi:hypothetical protein
MGWNTFWKTILSLIYLHTFHEILWDKVFTEWKRLGKRNFREIKMLLDPIPTILCHVIYYCGDKSYPCLVGIGLRNAFTPLCKDMHLHKSVAACNIVKGKQKVLPIIRKTLKFFTQRNIAFWSTPFYSMNHQNHQNQPLSLLQKKTFKM